MTYREIVDAYFLEHRAKVLDIAAFLDRLERAADGPPARDDFRVAALRDALGLLGDGQGERARRVLELLSDPSTEIPESARGMKGALGAAPEKST
ncbi:MAG: hypothetical protein KF886_13290 [Candidatus Hydrogenedentes bacterium]|nr:hypothetical protein [Candidatus Hydrogenedentota bacterium]